MSAPQAAARIMQRLEALAALTCDPPRLTRVFLSAEHRRANELVAAWMSEAGMRARVDAMGNIIGRVEGKARGLPALMLGSHLDTVRDAGRYDGMLGVVTAIECAHHIGAGLLPFALEVVGFGDEEGVRFGSTLLGSRAMAGTLDPQVLQATDRDGISVAAALRSFRTGSAAGRKRRPAARGAAGLCGTAHRAGAGAGARRPAGGLRHLNQWRHAPAGAHAGRGGPCRHGAHGGAAGRAGGGGRGDPGGGAALRARGAPGGHRGAHRRQPRCRERDSRGVPLHHRRARPGGFAAPPGGRGYARRGGRSRVCGAACKPASNCCTTPRRRPARRG